MKKYRLGALMVSDKGLQDKKEEIVIELIDCMQKYVAEGKEIFDNGQITLEEKLERIQYLCTRFCALSDFLVITMGIDIRRKDGPLYTREMFSNFFYWENYLEIELRNKTAPDAGTSETANGNNLISNIPDSGEGCK